MINRVFNFISLTAVAVAVTAHVTAFLQFHFLFESLACPPEWYIEVSAMMGVSFFIALLLPFLNKRKLLTFFLLVCRFALIAIIGFPFGKQIIVELTLLTSFVFESILSTATGLGAILSVTAIAATLYFQKESLAWGHRVASVSVEQLFYLGQYPVTVMVMGILLKYYHELAKMRRQYAERLKKSSSRLVEVNLKLQEHVIMKEDEAVLGERKRLSREIHDIIGHTLMSIILMMKAATRLSDKKNRKLWEFLLQTKNQAQKGLDETRRAMRELNSFGPPQLSLVSAVNRLIKAFQGTHVLVKAEFGNIPWSFDECINSVIYRIVQEGITNAIRHGDAHRIAVFFWFENDIIQISVSDDGQGCEDFTPGLGLKGIQERLNELHGRLETRSSTEGFELVVFIPLRKS